MFKLWCERGIRGSRIAKRTIRSNVQEEDFELDRCLAKI